MKYSLFNLLLAIALASALLGWFYDHRRLARDKARLNAEAADLFSRYTVEKQGFGHSSLDGRPNAAGAGL